MRVLITGASGFVGRSVSSALLQHEGLELHTVSRGELALGAQHHLCDLLVPEQVETLLQQVRPELLIHTAWYAEHGKFWEAEENLDWVGATLGLLRALRNAGGKRFVGIGTCAEYAWGGTEDLRELSSPLAPGTLYGAAKDAARSVLENYARAFDLQWAWARLFLMYGPGEASTRLFPSIATPLLRGERASCSPGQQLRDFMHVEDVGRAIACVALSELSGPVNVASGSALCVADFATQIESTIAGSGTLERGAILMRPGDPQRVVADVSRLQALGFRPKYDLQSGVARAVAQLRTELSS